MSNFTLLLATKTDEPVDLDTLMRTLDGLGLIFRGIAGEASKNVPRFNLPRPTREYAINIYDGQEDVARVVRDALQPCAVPPPSARPRCEHGKTEGHLYRPMPGPPMGVWCPGPRTQCEHGKSGVHYIDHYAVPYVSVENICPGPGGAS